MRQLRILAILALPLLATLLLPVAAQELRFDPRDHWTATFQGTGFWSIDKNNHGQSVALRIQKVSGTPDVLLNYERVPDTGHILLILHLPPNGTIPQLMITTDAIALKPSTAHPFSIQLQRTEDTITGEVTRYRLDPDGNLETTLSAIDLHLTR